MSMKRPMTRSHTAKKAKFSRTVQPPDVSTSKLCDSTTLSLLFPFIDPPDALRLAKASRRIYDIYRCTSHLRRVYAYQVAFRAPGYVNPQNRSLLMTLRSRAILYEPLLEYTFFFTDKKLSKKADLVLVDGLTTVRVNYKYNNARYWKCQVKGGELRDGEICVWKHVARRLQLDALTLSLFVGFEPLEYVAQHAPSGLRQANICSDNCSEYDISRFVEKMPCICDIEATFTISSTPWKFFENKAIRHLRSFTASNRILDGLTDENLYGIKWECFNYQRPTGLTPTGVKKVLDQWMQGQRQIIEWSFLIAHNGCTLEHLGQFLTGKPSKTATTLINKFGKKISVALAECEKYNQAAKCLFKAINSRMS